MLRVLNDEADAFEALYDRHAAAVYGLAAHMLRNASAAEDVAKDAFLALWRSRHSYRPERGAPRAWLLAITRNRAIDAMRRAGVRASEGLGAEDPEAPNRTDDQVLVRLDGVAAGTALRRLPDAERQALELSYFGGLTQTEIAARLGIPIGTVKARLRLGLQKLAVELRAPGSAQTAGAAAAIHERARQPPTG